MIGTGSKGNCYVLSDSRETLVIETGLPYKKILKGLNYNMANIVGVVISHSHL